MLIIAMSIACVGIIVSRSDQLELELSKLMSPVIVIRSDPSTELLRWLAGTIAISPFTSGTSTSLTPLPCMSLLGRMLSFGQLSFWNTRRQLGEPTQRKARLSKIGS